MQQVPALRRHAVAAQFVEAGRAPDVGGHAEVRLEQIRRRDHLAQDRARADELDARSLLRRLAAALQEIEPLENAFLRALAGVGEGRDADSSRSSG